MEGFANKNYVVDKVIRKKPLGNVYKARRVSDGVLCAIKELDVRHMSEEEKEDAMEEIRVLATVRNENVISYYDTFAGDNKLYVVMEYCDEPDLGRHIKTRAENQKFFSEAQVWSYLIQILRGLVAVHSRGLIHRDVRSGNIIQLDSSAVKIGDVRVGKVLKDGPAATTDIENPHCVPPEVWQNKAYTFKSDAWAVGCVLYEMITLAVPFGGCSLPDLRAKVILGQYQPIPSAFSTGLSNVVKLLLNPDQATRISARDVLLHPALQAHRHHAPAPAPMLRVRAFQEKNNLGSIPATTPISVEPKSSYPTLVVPVDDRQPPGQTLDSKKGVANPPGNDGHQAGLSSERPSAPAARSRVAPILAPRAVLSSRDNDEMLADVNRSPNQASKVKVPRVAMLSKTVPKSPSETSITPSQGVPSTPKVNMKHFKTAYIQSPKVLDPDEFQTTAFPDDISEVSRKEKPESLVNFSPGILRSRTVATPPTPKIVTPRREKSTESLRSAGSSRSDDSVRIRAPIDTMDSRHAESATPRRENSLESARSVASSRSGDSVIRVRAPVDVSDAPQASVVTQKGAPFKSGSSGSSSHSNGSAISVRAAVTDLDPGQPPVDVSDAPQASVVTQKGAPFRSGSLGSSSHSNGSAISVRAAVTDLDPAQPPLPISDYLRTSLAGDDGATQQASDLVARVDGPETSLAGDDGATQQSPDLGARVDGPEPSQRGNGLAGIEPLPSESLRVSSFDSSTPTSRASGTIPVTNQTKASTSNGAGRKTSASQVSGGKAGGDALDKTLPPSRNRRLSFGGGSGTERPWRRDPSKLAIPKRESPSGTRPSTSNPLKLATPKREGSLVTRPLTSDPSKLATPKREGSLGTRPLTSDPSKLATPKRESSLGTTPLTSDPSKLATLKRQSSLGTRPLKSDPSKLAALKREGSLGTRKPTEVNGVTMKGSIDAVTPFRAQESGTDRTRFTRPSPAPRQPPSDGPKKAPQNGAPSDGPKKASLNGDRSGGLPRKSLAANGKDANDVRVKSANPPKAGSTVAQTARKSSAHPSTGTAVNQAKNQGANAVNGGSTTRAIRAPSPQKAVQSRRLSLDLPIKEMLSTMSPAQFVALEALANSGITME